VAALSAATKQISGVLNQNAHRYMHRWMPVLEMYRSLGGVMGKSFSQS
jgi:hypothetical protein